MADSDKVILLKIEVAQAQANANVKKLEASLNNLDGRTKEYTLTLKKLQLERAKLSDLRAKSSKSIDTQVKSIQKLTKVQKEGKTAVGASTSATLELGRVLSDMPYGIRGVANNLQQLASNLFFMSKATDAATGKTLGFGGAVGTVIKGLAGPAGILIAFQGLIALWDYLGSGAKKAEENLNSFRITASKSASDLKSLLVVIKEDILSKDDLSDVIDKVNKKYKDLNLSINEEGKLTKESIRQIDNKIESLGKLALANAMMAEIQNKSSEIAKSAVELQKDTSEDLKELGVKDLESFKQRQDETEEAYVKRLNKMSQYQEGVYKGEIKVANVARVNRVKEEIKSFEETKERVEAQVKELLKISTSEGFFDNFFDSSSKKRGANNKRAKVTAFDTSQITKDAKKYVDEVMKMEKKNALLLATNNVDKLIIERDFQLKRLSMLKGDNSALIEEYVKYYDTLISVAEGKLLGKGKIDDKTPTKSGGSKEPFTLEEGLNAYMELQSSMTGFLNGEYDRQLTIEQNKTNALNNELNQRLLNENLSKDERERIQLQIGRNDDKLRKKQEEIERKRFKLNKAANMAGALINTYLSASKAYASQLIVGDPSSIIRAKIAAGVSIASGLLNVAAIARQKFQSSAGSGGTIGASGGGGGGGEGREFNFNLAGSTQSNQLTQSIASQLNQPIQAYVVSSEITSQQQLDLNISNTATIG
jgi:chromosome segregation ATPase